MRQIKKTLNDDYKRSGGKWMSDEELKDDWKTYISLNLLN